jgi:formylglycine-generating enzyme required for sulfatase activity
MQPLYDKYDQALAAVQTELTKANQLDDAMRVKTVREQIAATRGSGEGSAGTPARTTSTGGAAAPMTEADKSVRAPLIVGAYTNSLGMKFVPVPETDILMCIHETRRRDYAAYVAENPRVNDGWNKQFIDDIPANQLDSHPVVSVTWDEAVAYCAWLSKKEGKTYRLPTDKEWSYAVGIGRKERWIKGATPQDRHKDPQGEYPWEGNYPPKTKDLAGNYADMALKAKSPDSNIIDGYNDGFPFTAPVMSFKPNKLGIYDLGGNVFEWCDDWYDAAQTMRTVRSSSYLRKDGDIASHFRPGNGQPTTRTNNTGFRIVVDTRAPASPSGAATKPATPTPTPATAANSDFTNSLGMKFVKVSGTKVMFCIHETRYKDYAAYAAAAPDVNPRWKNQILKGIAPKDRTEDHPVVIVSWEDAQAFCVWLSQKEGKRYRLPKDEEWSYAAGIGRDEKRKKGDTPATVLRVKEYPWGSNWPPSKGCENYGDESYNAAISVPKYLTGYDDGYPTTAPVMSFKPNRYGLYDMGGNVSEWCEEWLNNTQTSRVLRGSSWKGGANDFELLSSARGQAAPATREDQYGFRIVVEITE